ncbi:MAG: hypothetical protein LUQ69_09440, partial [Methanoregulaceae archaeon]|nr:hypothetical protein [Methanoregulaceae archaeon]
MRYYGLFILMFLFLAAVLHAAPAKGPLRVLQSNPRLFTDGSGKAVYLVGSHTWNNGVEIIQNTTPPNPTFDYPRYISWLKELNHNCFRLWTWEDAFAIDSTGAIVYVHEPLAYPRTGPGTCADGKPKFDISKFDPVYFNRLEARVKMAQDSGMYAIVQLFAGWSP